MSRPPLPTLWALPSVAMSAGPREPHGDSHHPVTFPAYGAYSCAASPGVGKILPYLFTRSVQITPLTVMAKGAMSRAQSEKPWNAITLMATPRRTSPPPSIALAKTIGLRFTPQGYLEFPGCRSAAPALGVREPAHESASCSARSSREPGRASRSWQIRCAAAARGMRRVLPSQDNTGLVLGPYQGE
jgi:hypothetical protein